MNDREDGRVGSNANGQSKNNDGAEAGITARKLSVLLLAGLAAIALLLATLGTYGVMAYMVTGRTQENLRPSVVRWCKAPEHILRMVLAQGMRLALWGVLSGVVAALAIGRLVSPMLAGVTARDPLTFASVGGLLLLVSLAACYVPARKAGVPGSNRGGASRMNVHEHLIETREVQTKITAVHSHHWTGICKGVLNHDSQTLLDEPLADWLSCSYHSGIRDARHRTRANLYRVDTFTGGIDGATPYGGLTWDRGSKFYGTAAQGGYTGTRCYSVFFSYANGCGTVFRLHRIGNFELDIQHPVRLQRQAWWMGIFDSHL